MDTITLDLGEVEYEIDDAPRELMLDNLRDMLGEEEVNHIIRQAIEQNVQQMVPIDGIITNIYDQRNELAEVDDLTEELEID